MPDRAKGLTPAGLARLNQSIEAFVYCILGAQVNVRSSIVGDGGRAKEVQREFLVLLEDAIRTPDISKSVQRYQMAVDEAKVRLDLAVAPEAWLMPSRMILNTGSVVGYNNKLRQVGPGMKLGVNKDVNKGTKKSALHLMGRGPSKINTPNRHPSNTTHKAAKSESVPVSRRGEGQSPAAKPKSQPKPEQKKESPSPGGGAGRAPGSSGNASHDVNKNSRGGRGRCNRGFGLSSAALIWAEPLTILFYISLHHKGDHNHNQQPGVLGQKPDGLAGGFKNERNNRDEQARQEQSRFFADLFQPVPQPFAQGFQRVCDRANHGPNRDASRENDRCDGKAVFFEDRFHPGLSRRGSSFSLSAICVCKRASSSFLSATLSRVASLPVGEASGSSINS